MAIVTVYNAQTGETTYIEMEESEIIEDVIPVQQPEEDLLESIQRMQQELNRLKELYGI